MSALPRQARSLVALALVIFVVASVFLLAPRSASLVQQPAVKDKDAKVYEAPMIDCDLDAVPNQYSVKLAPDYGFEEHRGLVADRGRSTKVLKIDQSGKSVIYLAKILDDAALAAIRTDKKVESVQCDHGVENLPPEPAEKE